MSVGNISMKNEKCRSLFGFWYPIHNHPDIVDVPKFVEIRLPREEYSRSAGRCFHYSVYFYAQLCCVFVNSVHLDCGNFAKAVPVIACHIVRNVDCW